MFFLKEKFDFTFNCLYVGVWEGVHADESRSPQKADALDLPGTRVYWELSSSPLQGQSPLLDTEPSLQPL